MTARHLADLRDMALTKARVARRRGDVARARDHLALAFWCRGRLRALAPRPWRGTFGTLDWQ